jgi:exo-1,4-beta-D-glucosaminidase
VPKIDGARIRLEQRRCARLIGIFLSVTVLAGFSPAVLADSPEQSNSTLELHSGWMLESSCRVKTNGEQISRAGFRTSGWQVASVPSTVVAALVDDKTFPDPYFGTNLRSIPGTTYPIGQNFSLLAIPKDSPFRCSWWYRNEFAIPQDFAGRHVWLHFDGINNRANVWINGRRIASAKDVAGAYRTYEFDVTPVLVKNSMNALAVETIAQTENDLGINWVDWNPAPPDKNLGLWRKVYLRASGAVRIRYPQVVTHFPYGSADRADLTVEAELHNASSEQMSGELRGEIEQVAFQQNIVLGPGETRTVRFNPAEFPQLRVAHPTIWWPAQMGAPNLHELSLRFSTGEGISDTEKIRFGIREVSSEIDNRRHRIFRINGEKILIRGAGWVPDMLLRESGDRLKTEFRYVRDLNLNAIRLEGKMETDEFFNLADEQGVLVMAGWSCCDYWEQWQKWKTEDLAIATASLRSQIMRMRSHPSVLAWLNGSDNPPPANVEKAYIEVLKDVDWPNPYVSSASGSATTVTGPSGVKMTGPYDYVAPDYWLTADGKYGGAEGFITETSAGPSLPLIGSLRKMLPEGELVPDSASWNYHAGSLGFKDLSHVEEAMKAIYGAPSGIGDYELKAQAMAYDSERAMFEAYSRNKYGSTGIIQWMLNNAWPSLIWHLYDYYLQPGGGYFGAKKACEPLHVMYSYDDRSVEVVNSRYEQVSGLLVKAAVYDIGLHQRFSGQSRIDVGADAVARVLTLPEEAFGAGSPVHFVNLELEDSAGHEVGTNFYWISAKKTVYDWSKTTYRYTPATSYEDFSALRSLARAGPVGVSADIEKGEEGAAVHVKIENRGDQLAFQLHLGISRKGEEGEIVPVLWQDNYIELIPGESREIMAQFLSADALHGVTELRVSGWNIAPVTIGLWEPGTTAQAGGKN